MCLTITKELDFEGIFLITAGSSVRNPDSVFLDNFTLYNPKVAVSAGHNKHVHEAHKKKAVHDMS